MCLTVYHKVPIIHNNYIILYILYTFCVCLTFYHKVPIMYIIVLIIFEFNLNIIVTVMSLNVMSPKRRAKKNLKYIIILFY